MNNNTRKFFSFLAASLTSLSASAAIIDHGTYITDTVSNLDWLKLSETRSKGFIDISHPYWEGRFDGWIYATGEQFEALAINAGAVSMQCTNGTNFCGWSAANNNTIGNLINSLGDIEETYHYGGFNTSTPYAVHGYIADKYNNARHYIAELGDWPMVSESLTMDKISTHSTWELYDYQIDPSVGSFLIRPSAVPVPAAAWLMGSGLIGLAAIKRRRK